MVFDAYETFSVPPQDGPELFFGLVGAIGTDLRRATEILTEILGSFNYKVNVIRLSDVMSQIPEYQHLKNKVPTEKYYNAAIDAGNAIREKLNTNRALAHIAAVEVMRLRSLQGSDQSKRVAYIFHSLKLPEEVAALRQIYDDLFYCIAIYSNREKRKKNLTERINEHYGDPARRQSSEDASELLDRDEKESNKFGQNVREAFVEADFFIRTDKNDEMQRSLNRFISLIFDKPYISPTREEVAMMHAKTAALRSADLSRQVGAVIIDRDGQILATGCNEVPKAGGGQYWADDKNDQRDFQVGHDANDTAKRKAVIEFLSRIRDLIIPEKIPDDDIEKLYNHLVAEKKLKGTRIDALIEFGRIVHAEMAAIDSACMNTISIRDADLYCMTFPCHMCARLIINVGIRNVFYIEPYPKSAAGELYEDSVSIDPQLTEQAYEARLNQPASKGEHVHFIPFRGVAPRRYQQLFVNGRRKSDSGQVQSFKSSEARPRNSLLFQTHFELEKIISDIVAEKLGDTFMPPKTEE